MSNIVIYSSIGRISSITSAPEGMLQMQIQEGEFGIENVDANLNTDYVLDNTVTPRPVQTITLDKLTLTADGAEVVTILGVAVGSTIAISGLLPENTAFSETCSDPETFSTEIPDTYTLTISCFPYLDFTATIEAI